MALATMRWALYDFWNEIVEDEFRFCPLFSGTPVKILTLLGSYIFFAKVLGPRIMANRKPLNIKGIIFGYNVTMSVLNFIFVIGALKYTNYGMDNFGCRGKYNWRDDPNGKLKLFGAYVYGWSRVADLLDTVFFVLRKNFSHITFLHVYHHTDVVFLVYLAFNFNISEYLIGFIILNSTVHTLMYAYYALSTLGPRVKPYLWWKKQLTTFQIGHLILYGMVYFGQYLYYSRECFPSPIFVFYGFIQGVLMIGLFFNFYYQTYVKRKAAAVKLASTESAIKDKSE